MCHYVFLMNKPGERATMISSEHEFYFSVQRLLFVIVYIQFSGPT